MEARACFDSGSSRDLLGLFPAATPRADELDLARAGVDLPLLNLPELLLAHCLHLVRLGYLPQET